MPRSKSTRGIACVLSLIALAIVPSAWADPATEPATQPTVASVLADMDAAYAKLQSAQFDGRLIEHFDATGRQINDDVAFTSSFAAPNQFRHEIPNQILLGSTGTNAYAFLNSRDEYQTTDAPKTRAALSEWPASITNILQNQNPSLLLAMSKSAADELKSFSEQITLLPQTTIDGTAYDTLQFDVGDDHQIVTMLVDPATHLLRQMKTDLRQSLKDAGTTNVKLAEVTVDYTRTVPDAPVAGDVFGWTVPAGAILASTANALTAANDPSDEQKAMVGKPAPDFSLKNLDDAPVKLSDLKGSVVILDFWATWCAPCLESLPHLDQLYKDQSPHGLKVLAVNLSEEKDKVKGFIQKRGLSLPVVLDTDGTVAESYKGDQYPVTVVVGKDGLVKQYFVGIGHEQELSTLVEAELKK